MFEPHICTSKYSRVCSASVNLSSVFTLTLATVIFSTSWLMLLRLSVMFLMVELDADVAVFADSIRTFVLSESKTPTWSTTFVDTVHNLPFAVYCAANLSWRTNLYWSFWGHLWRQRHQRSVILFYHFASSHGRCGSSLYVKALFQRR